MTDKLNELICRIKRMLTENRQIIIAIDGRCAAGKTTLAKMLSEHFDCNVFHMDDFFLRPEQRTSERFAEIGGNVDYERFHAEVVIPMKALGKFSYRPYNCQTQSLKEPVDVQPKPLNIIEGTYSVHPSLAYAYDMSIFLDISPELQEKRIAKRSPEKLEMFLNKWIPLEERYFDGSLARKRCSVYIECGELLEKI